MIASRIIKLRSTDEMAIPDNCLRKLNLVYNRVRQKILRGDSKEKEALLTILNTFNEISFCSRESCGSDVEYLLRINHAGRKFIAGGGEEKDGGTTTMAIENNNNSEPSPPNRTTKQIKPELWPTILERAYEKSDKVNNERKKCATGIFYLLRNGSVLEDIISMRQNSSNGNGNSSDDGNGNNNSSNGNGNEIDNGSGNGNKRPRSSRSFINTVEDEGSDSESSLSLTLRNRKVPRITRP